MTINKYDDIIDSRDVIERIEELEGFLGDEGHSVITDSELDELQALKSLQAEAEGYSDDWTYGVVLIRDSYFETYAEELAEDTGAINPDANWPNSCIDWEQAAHELQIDYTQVEFDGIDYWVR